MRGGVTGHFHRADTPVACSLVAAIASSLALSHPPSATQETTSVAIAPRADLFAIAARCHQVPWAALAKVLICAQSIARPACEGKEL